MRFQPILLSFILLLFVGSTLQAEDNPEIEFIIDSSSSMSTKAYGRKKIDSAIESLKLAINELPQSTKVSLRVFGSVVSQRNKERSCEDTQLAIDFTDPKSFSKKLKNIEFNALGYSALAKTLKESASDFSNSKVRTVVLYSDGLDTCEGNPEDVIKDLYAQGIIVRLFIASTSSKAEENKKLSNLAAITGGSFTEIKDLNTSIKALKDLTSKAVSKLKVEKERPGDADGLSDAGDFALSSLVISAETYKTNYIGGDDKSDFYNFHASVGERYQLKLEIKGVMETCSLAVLDSDQNTLSEAKKIEGGFETDIFTTDDAKYLIKFDCVLPKTTNYSFSLNRLRAF